MIDQLSNFIFGEASKSHLPERVRESINHQQIASERLITWFQVLLVTVFGILYSLSPKMLHGNSFQPVPWALTVYFAFTMIRMFIAYRRNLASWFLTLSIIMDMTLLMTLIWSFHIQYEQPPSFYLKAPTMIYVFIFISLRALRFEPKYIIYSGIAAALGWGALVWYVVDADATSPMITKDYVAYMTSNSILIGAEIDKIVSILLVTTVLAVAVLRARRIFNKAVLDSSAAKDLSRFVSTEVAERITRADRAIQPGDGELRNATVLFTDIEGFSTVSEQLSPQQLAQMLNEYFMALNPVLEKYGAVVTLFEGDMLLATFNAVNEDPDHAENALMTAIGFQEVLATKTFGEKKVRLPTRRGINSGDIAVGAIGIQDHLSFTVHGDNVNIAARLEPLNKEYGTYILAGENTAVACSDKCEFKQVGEVTVRGRTAPTKIYCPVY